MRWPVPGLASVVIEVLEPAALEFEAAAAWYEQRTRGLGARFLDELEDTFDLIEQMPLAGSPWLLPEIPPGTRHVPLRTFPHSVVYVTEPRVVVVAVVHGSRDPEYWIDRLGEL